MQNTHKTKLGRKLSDFSRRAQQDYKEFLFCLADKDIPIDWNRTTAYNKIVVAVMQTASQSAAEVSQIVCDTEAEVLHILSEVEAEVNKT